MLVYQRVMLATPTIATFWPSGQVQPAGFRRVLHGTGIHHADVRGIQGVDQGVAVHGQLAHHVLLDRPEYRQYIATGNTYQKTMENHHFKWGKPHYKLPFSIAMLNYQR